MFSVFRSVSKSKLAELKSDAEYAALLDTPVGEDFLANVGDSNRIKRDAYFIASEIANSSKEAGEGSATSSIQGTGLSCLAADKDITTMTLREKLDVLNCLAFDTDHSFWLNQPTEKEHSALYLHPQYRALLGFENWDCTFAWDGPLSACHKHDVAWSSLRKFVDGDEGDDTLDAAWNPRNKHLADRQFKIDIAVHGCNAPPLYWELWPAVWPAVVCGAGKTFQSERMYWAVASLNHKGWPVTDEDESHVDDNYEFVECNGGLPRVSNVGVTRSGRTFTARWTYREGCISGITADEYRLTWDVGYPYTYGLFRERFYTDSSNSVDEFTIPAHITNPTSVTLVSISIRPDNRDYGSNYYPEQVINIAVTATGD